MDSQDDIEMLENFNQLGNKRSLSQSLSNMCINEIKKIKIDNTEIINDNKQLEKEDFTEQEMAFIRHFDNIIVKNNPNQVTNNNQCSYFNTIIILFNFLFLYFI